MARTQPYLSPREMLEKRYKSARLDLLLIIILTVVNVIMLLTGSDSMLLFSISVPYYAVVLGYLMADSVMLTTGCVIAAVMLAVYLLCWIFSKKRSGWLVAALVLFIVDTLVMGGMYLLAGELSGIMDVLIHGLVLFDLIRGIIAVRKLKTMPEEVIPDVCENVGEAEVQTEVQAEETSYSAPLRRAQEDVKHRVLLEDTFGGHRIVYRRVKRVNELVVSGYVYDEYEAVAEYAHCLSARIDGHLIEVGFDGVSASYLRVDGKEIKRKIRLF